MDKRKAGREWNWQFHSWPLKVKNCPDFFVCGWRAYIPLESFRWGLQFCFRPHLNKKSAHKIMGLQSWNPKSKESQLWKFRDFHLGVPGQNDIWVLVPLLSTKYIIRGKVVAFSKSGPWWDLFVCVYLWFVYATKWSNYALTNLLFGLWMSMWVIEMLVNLPSPIVKFQHTPLPLKCFEPRNVP
jgi:hypothetical protein